MADNTKQNFTNENDEDPITDTEVTETEPLLTDSDTDGKVDAAEKADQLGGQILRVLVFGPPGAGKNIQSMRINKEFGLVNLSTGDMLRREILEETPVGVEAKSYMDEGRLVPDDVVTSLLQERINNDDVLENGFVLNGYPRTLAQAKSLEGMLGDDLYITHVLNIDCDVDVLKERIMNRWTHIPSGRTYHPDLNPPKVAGKDNVTGEDLVQRDDDLNGDSFVNRLQLYDMDTVPTLEFYNEQSARRCHEIDGSKGKEEVWESIYLKLIPRKKVQFSGNDDEEFEDEMEDMPHCLPTLSLTPSQMSAEIFSQYKGIFKAFDKDGDGRLSTSEFRQTFARYSMMVDQAELLDLVSNIDENEDGEVEWDEFIALMEADMGETLTDTDIRKAFGEADTDDDGFLDAEDIYKFMKALGEEDITMEDALMMIDGADQNKSGRIEYSEFSRIILAADWV